MRRAPAWIVVVGVIAGWVGTPPRAKADDGFWVTIATGAAGSAGPSDYAEFWFDSPHAPPVAVNHYSGGSAIQATTAGGNTFFTTAGTPVLLPTADGYATITNPAVPNGSGGLPQFAGGTMASGAPQTGVPIDGANLLSIGLGDPALNGDRLLNVGLTDSQGKPIGSGEVTVPDGGWWVIGLGPGEKDTGGNPDPGPGPGPGPDPGPIGGGGNNGGGNPDPGPVPVPNPGQGGSVATPEPTSLALAGIGGIGAMAWRRLRRK